MIVSPPFLPPRPANTTDEQWLALAMPEASSGRFPVSLHAAWHGGVHLLAPADAAGTALPVSAIADGEVVFVRAPAAKSTDPHHAQNYGSAAGPVWTDNGCIVLRHTTELGLGAGNAAVSVTFFSVYMHLSALAAGIQTTVATPPQRVFRKEALGTAGQVYDQNNVLHFEIVCDDTNLAAIVGRTVDPATASPPNATSGGGLPFSQNGRTTALFGARYFFVPVGAATFSRSPVEFRLALDAAQAEARRLGNPIPTTLPDPPTRTGTLAQAVLVRIEYAKGDASVTTTELDGTLIQTPITTTGLEYDLLVNANDLSKFVSLTNADASTPAADVPPTSACLELLQFGQVLGPDALTPATTPNWWQVKLPRGSEGFVDLNGTGVFKYSDADFPQWQGWHFVDGTIDQDALCNDPFVLDLLDADGNGVTEAETDPTAFSAELVKKLSRLVVNFPTEWDANGLDARWAFLKTAAPFNPNPLNAADFATFLAHAQALCFWDATAIGLGATHWHFHPTQFLLQMRKAFWFTGVELAQCIPRQAAAGLTPFAAASTRGSRHATPLSDMFRRYGIASQDRVIHMLAQIILETAFMRTVTEDGRGNTKTYAAFYGRGYMQLTHPEAYITYGKYRKLPNHTAAYADTRITTTSTHPKSDGTLIVWSPRFDPNLLETDLFTGADSAGHFWLNKHYAGTHNLNREADLGLGGNIVGALSRLVNGGANGYDARQEFVGFLLNVLGDEPLKSGTETRSFPRLQTALHTFPPGTPANDRNVTVHHTPRQRP